MTAIRRATSNDAKGIGELAERSNLFPAELIDAMIAPSLMPDSEELWLVASTGSELDGFAYSAPEKLTEGTYNLLALAVAVERRTSGVGSSLLAETEHRLAGRGGRLLLVETSSQPNFEPTIAFYCKRDFEQEARIRDYWSAGDDKLIFRKAIEVERDQFVDEHTGSL